MFAKLVAACAFLVAVAGIVTAGPPNVLLILGDDQAWTDYGFMGHPQIKTPNLDRLAADSLVFERGYVPTSLCRASLASIMTGLWPQDHGITSNDPALPVGWNLGQAMKDPRFLADRAKMVARFNEKPSLVKLLGGRGYKTLQTGKWWEGEACRCGFTEGMTHGDPARGGRHGDEGLTIGRQGLKPCTDFIDRCQKEGAPFFVWYAPIMPHDPHTPPEKYLNQYKDKTKSIHVARYWAMCAWFDETIGSLLDHLKKRQLENDTIVVYLADNGWIQNPDGPGFAPRSKRSPYDGGLRTPILIRIPGHPDAGKRFSTLASSIDLMPTLLAATGTVVANRWPGVNLTDAGLVRSRSLVSGATFTHNAVSIDEPARNLEWRWLVTSDGWKLMVPNGANVMKEKPHLFRIERDPYELDDLFEKEPEQARRLRALLDDWWKG